MFTYDVCIVGGGPSALACGLELGRLDIKTAIFEKHAVSLPLPRAQLLNSRSMEFFTRWGISKQLRNEALLPKDYPLSSVRCSGMAGKVHSVVNLAEKVNPTLTPEYPLRVPLWITERIMREQLNAFPCVKLFMNTKVESVTQNDQCTMLEVYSKKDKSSKKITAKYVLGCDGANSNTREDAKIEMESLGSAKKVISVVFSSLDLKKKMRIDKGILYYIDSNAIGIIDYNEGLWYAQIFSPDLVGSIEEKELYEKVSLQLDKIAGFAFDKKITHAAPWIMHPQNAKHYRNNRIFLVGDAAHTLPPTGGLGLNTGLGDVVNLCWKLAMVLNNPKLEPLLDTYEIERQPVADRNIDASGKNAKELLELSKRTSKDKEDPEYAKENQRLNKQHGSTLGLAMGYRYGISSGALSSQSASDYTPIAEPGFCAPHLSFGKDGNLYDRLSKNYTLLIISTEDAKETKDIEDVDSKEIIDVFKSHGVEIDVQRLSLKEDQQAIYKDKYYVLRPDWHIQWCGSTFPKNDSSRSSKETHSMLYSFAHHKKGIKRSHTESALDKEFEHRDKRYKPQSELDKESDKRDKRSKRVIKAI